MANYEAFTLYMCEHLQDHEECDVLGLFLRDIWDTLRGNKLHPCDGPALEHPAVDSRGNALTCHQCDKWNSIVLASSAQSFYENISGLYLGDNAWLICDDEDEEKVYVHDMRAPAEGIELDEKSFCVKDVINKLSPEIICACIRPTPRALTTEDTIAFQPDDFPTSAVIILDRRKFELLSDKFVGQKIVRLHASAIPDIVVERIQQYVDRSVEVNDPDQENHMGYRVDMRGSVVSRFTIADHIAFHHLLTLLGIKWDHH